MHKGKGNLRPGLGVVYAPPNFSSTANGRGKRVRFDDARTHRSKVPVVILASLVIALLGQQFWSWKEKNNFFAKPCCVSAQFKSMCLALSAIAPAVNERQILGEKKTPFSAPIGQVSKVFRSGRFFYFLSQVNWWVSPPPLKLSSWTETVSISCPTFWLSPQKVLSLEVKQKIVSFHLSVITFLRKTLHNILCMCHF